MKWCPEPESNRHLGNFARIDPQSPTLTVTPSEHCYWGVSFLVFKNIVFYYQLNGYVFISVYFSFFMSSGKLIVQLHNFSSVNLCREFVKIALGLGAKDIIFSKAAGAGATTGVPIAQKMAHSKQANVLYLQDLPDTIELVAPDQVYLFIKRPFSKEVFNQKMIADAYSEGKTILLVFGGAEPGLSKKELDMGTSIYFDKINEIGCLGELALSLYLIRQNLRKE